MAKHGRKMRRGDTITRAEAYEVLLSILAHDVLPKVQAKFAGAALHVIEAGCSAVYNLGPGSLGWKWAGVIARGAVAIGADLWRKMGITAGGKRYPGLVRRRAEEADIAEFDRWPAWVTETNVAPETHVERVDVQQAQLWLNQLGYECGRADGIPGLRTVEATKRFQKDHGTLKVDGIIGPATLAALQRSVDLKKSATVTGTATGGAVVAGTGENATGAGDAVQLPADAPWATCCSGAASSSARSSSPRWRGAIATSSSLPSRSSELRLLSPPDGGLYLTQLLQTLSTIGGGQLRYCQGVASIQFQRLEQVVPDLLKSFQRVHVIPPSSSPN